MKRMLSLFCSLLLIVSLLIGCFSGLSVSAATPKEPSGICADNILSPINPNANQEAKNLLAFMSSLAENQKMVVGQFDIATQEDDSQFEALNENFGEYAGMYSARYEAIDDNGKPVFTNVDKVNAKFKKHYDQGAILLVHADMVTDFMSQIAVKKGVAVAGNVNDLVVHLDSTNPGRDKDVYAYWEEFVNANIAALKKLEESGVRDYLLRTFVECDLSTFWGCTSNGYAHFINVQKQFKDRLIAAGLKGVLFCSSPTAHNSTVNAFPGTDTYDIMGLTLYGGGSGYLNATYFEDYSWYCKTGKPIVLTENSCRHGGWATVRTDPRGSWYNVLMTIRDYWPRVCMINAWAGGHYSLANTTDGDLANGNDDGRAMMDSPFSMVLKDLPDYRQGIIKAPGVVQIYQKKNYEGEYVGLEQRTYTVNQLNAMGLDMKRISSVRTNRGFCLELYTGPNATGDKLGIVGAMADVAYLQGKGIQSVRVSGVNNVALNKDGIYASEDDDNAYKANDGSASMWRVYTTSGSGWLTVDLEEPHVISRYVVKHAGSADQDASFNTANFALQYSMDEVNWITVDQITGNTSSVTDRYVPSFTAQYLRLYISKANSSSLPSEKNLVSISEWEVYGIPSGDMQSDLPQEPGLYKIDGEWLYVKDGEIQYDFSGFVKHIESNTWFYVTDGKIDWNLDGAFKHPSGIWFIVKGGQIDWGFNGFYKANGVWFYFKNGQIVWETTGLYKHPSGTWFYVKNAQIDWGYTGFAKHNESNTWFYCENGTIAWSKSGAFKHPSGIWFMVNGGQIDWKFNGFYKVQGIWFYFENGQINWDLTGLYKLPSANAWFYVKNAQIDWTYNGTATKNGVTFNVRNGQVIF